MARTTTEGDRRDGRGDAEMRHSGVCNGHLATQC